VKSVFVAEQKWENLTVEIRGSTLWVTINRPEKRNALSRQTLSEIEKIFAGIGADSGSKIVVLTGAGDRSFAAGGDLSDLAAVRTLDEARTMAVDAKRALEAVRRCPLPVVALLNGDALGGGAELAAACDFRVATADARIGFIQGRLNISTAWGGGVDLAAIVGPTAALRLLASARILDGPTAKNLGLLEEVADNGESGADVVARFITDMLSQTPQVLSTFKRLVAACKAGEARPALLEMETELFARNWIHDDHWAAADTILTKRTA